jgi:hypothetical protein
MIPPILKKDEGFTFLGNKFIVSSIRPALLSGSLDRWGTFQKCGHFLLQILNYAILYLTDFFHQVRKCGAHFSHPVHIHL